MNDAECQQIDQFIAQFKTLEGLMPPWKNYQQRDFQSHWAILDENEIQYGELKVISDRWAKNMTIVAVHQQRMFYRLDIVPKLEMHPNPFGADALGLPLEVTGPHIHGWSENRDYVRVNGFSRLPYRRQIAGDVQLIADALHWVVKDLNITVTGEQRVVELPDKVLL